MFKFFIIIMLLGELYAGAANYEMVMVAQVFRHAERHSIVNFFDRNNIILINIYKTYFRSECKTWRAIKKRI
jgi:hypothetical protein